MLVCETAGHDPLQLLEIAGPLALKNSRVLLLEPTDSSEAELRRRLSDGSYDKPFILDQGVLRFLHFDLEQIQSLMCRNDPDALCLRYTRKMMAFLLFKPRPRRILILGLGGGSLAKYCYRRLPSATITVLETDPLVLALRGQFCVPADDERFRVLEGDGVDYVARPGLRKDVILVDAYDRRGMAHRLVAAQFFWNARRRLTPGGVLVANIYGDTYERACQFATIRGVFANRVIALPVRDDSNLIVLAFRSEQALRNWDRREGLAHELQQRFGLNFPRFVRRMRRSPQVTALHPLT